MLESLLQRIKERNHRGIAKQTEKLDVQQRQNLQEFLEDVPEERLEMDLVEEEIAQAYENLFQMQEKVDFIGTRLRSYQRQLSLVPKDDNDDDDHEVDEKRKQNLAALQKVETIHKQMFGSMENLKERIRNMEKRKVQLQLHLEECQVVLEVTQNLDQEETRHDLTLAETATLPGKETHQQMEGNSLDEENPKLSSNNPNSTETTKQQEEHQLGKDTETLENEIPILDEEIGDTSIR